MKFTFLGTGAICPDLLNSTSLVFQATGCKEYLLVDTGIGGHILKELIDCGYDPRGVQTIFISHIHMDHSLGLPALFFRISNLKNITYADEKVFTVATGPETWDKLVTITQYTAAFERSEIEKKIGFLDITKNQTLKGIAGFDSLSFFRTSHEKNRPGRTPVESYGIVIESEGKKIVYPADTIPLDITAEKAYKADFLIHEVFCPNEDEIANRSGHSSAAQVAKMAQRAAVKKLVFTHFVATYMNQKEEMREEAAKYFDGEIIFSQDYMTIEV